MTFHTRRVKPALGFRGGNGWGRRSNPVVSIGFDPAMFERIAGEAARRELPFGEVVREKVLQAYQREDTPLFRAEECR